MSRYYRKKLRAAETGTINVFFPSTLVRLLSYKLPYRRCCINECDQAQIGIGETKTLRLYCKSLLNCKWPNFVKHYSNASNQHEELDVALSSKWIIWQLTGLFRRGVLSHVHASTHSQKFRNVINCLGKSSFWLHALIHNCLCFIDRCVYSHVTFKEAAVVDY